MRRSVALAGFLLVVTLPVAARAQETATLRAGVGVVDATWRVGSGAGQYTEKEQPSGDPHALSTTQRDSYGVASRLTMRAVVLEGTNGKRVALLKSDLYLAQDQLLRRVGQLLADAGSSITPDAILHTGEINGAEASIGIDVGPSMTVGTAPEPRLVAASSEKPNSAPQDVPALPIAAVAGGVGALGLAIGLLALRRTP